MSTKTLFPVVVLALVVALMVPAAALANNQAGQSASTSYSSGLSVVGKSADTAITTITFPEGTPSANVSTPYNDVDGTGDSQVLHTTTSEPVVRIKNATGGNLLITLTITTWSNSVVAAEHYELVDTTTTSVNAVNDVLSATGAAATTATGVTINDASYKALYLQVTLGASAGKSGTSTLSVLGETP